MALLSCLPAVFAKKEIMSSSSAGKCSSTKVPSRASPADVFLLMSRLGELDLFVWA